MPKTAHEALVSACDTALRAILRTDPDGRFAELDEAADALADALRQARAPLKGAETLADVFEGLPKVDLEIERSTDPGREIDL